MRVIFCDCPYRHLVPAETRQRALAWLASAGPLEGTATVDLCRLAAVRHPVLGEWASTADLVVVACYPRAVRGLFAAAGAPLPATGVRFVNLRTESVAALEAALPRSAAGVVAGIPSAHANAPDAWAPWFPVIDRARCRNCRQCLSFCLFGVYSAGPDGHVEVAAPRNCKTNCPACARICPDVAIMFPKYDRPPINGAEVGESAVTAPSLVGLDMDALFTSDVYAALNRRRLNSGVRLLRQQPLEQALHERRDCAKAQPPAGAAAPPDSPLG